jgi:polynucleotide 5'-kinase involved in rRNA processing
MTETKNETENFTITQIDSVRNNNVFVEAPLQLIDFKDGLFELNSQAMATLKEINDDIVIVSVVGKARTGKSYLMNLLLENTGKERGVTSLLNIV